MGSDRKSVSQRFHRGSLPAIAVIFVVVFGLSQWLTLVLENAGRLQWLMVGTATLLTTIIEWLGIPVTQNGILLYLTNHTLAIDLDCTGLTIAALYVSLIVAYPLSARTRTLAIAVGLPVIVLANLLRLVGVALASQYLNADMFFFAHDYLFKVVMVFVVIGLWAVWLQMARAHATRT
jgi:exosortase/archaeosortase family protein